jgi:hypothetical protein
MFIEYWPHVLLIGVVAMLVAGLALVINDAENDDDAGYTL